MADSLLIGLSALQAHKRAMDTTSHNIANAATPGYTRQEVGLSTISPELVKPGTLGRGVQVEYVRRNSDALLTERLRESGTEIGRLETMGKVLSDLEAVYNEPGDGGLSSVFNNLFATFQDLSNNPESTALRAGAIQNLETFTATINSLYSNIEQQRDNLVLQARDEVGRVNELLSQVAKLNQQVSREVLVGNNPNDMEDQRDKLIRELSQHIDVRTIRDPHTGSVRIDANGQALVGTTTSFPLAVTTTTAGGIQLVYESSRSAVESGGGSLAALEELSNETIPSVLADINELTSTIIAQFNKINATGVSHTYDVGVHGADRIVDINLTAVNLDDPRHAENAANSFGIPAPFAPSFIDSSGNDIETNLTINVMNTATGVAEKYTLRYDPGLGAVANSRSLEDMVSAINTGRGGGFSVFPPNAGGVDGVTARAVGAGNGVRLQLIGDTDLSIDFSSALDTRPSDSAWTGGTVSASVGASIPALSNQRLVFEVANGGTDLNLFTIDPITGNNISYPGLAPANQMAINPAGATVIGGVTVNFSALGTYTDGQSFAVDFDFNGDVVPASATTVPQWTGTDAGFMLTGRYTGDHSFDPARQWSMNVISAGTVGDENNAPVVEFSFYTGPEDARILETKLVTLDENVQAGEQVEIADGVYVIFDDGDLTLGNQVSFTVDNQPDQAGLLVALGINGIFEGGSASEIKVRDQLLKNPSFLAISSSRSAGDNSNLLKILGVRDQQVFEGGESTMDGFYQSQVSRIAVQVSQTEILAENQTLVQASLENKRDEVSGVSIDEEVGLLILQQQAYSAAARIISTARENIDTLLGILN